MAGATVIPGRNTQTPRQFNYALLCPLILRADKEAGITVCRNICCNIVKTFSQESGVLLSVMCMVFNPHRSNKLDDRIKFAAIIQSLHGCKYRNGASRQVLSSKLIYVALCEVFVSYWLAGKVLVHCAMGLSRSSTLVLAYLMICENMTLVDAIKAVSSNRNISPNAGFLEQLRELDKELHCQASLCVSRRT